MKTATRELPILFSGEMVREILAGTKTQTRRVMKQQPQYWQSVFDFKDGTYAIVGEDFESHPFRCPYGEPGDRLWVRETWAPIPEMKPSGYFTDPKWKDRVAWYAADNDKPTWGGKWRPSIHMPRIVSRILLEVTEVRVHRLQDISESDCEAEGIDDGWLVRHKVPPPRRYSFRQLWDGINEDRGYGWNVNPWVWAISFRRIDGGMPA